MAASRFRRGPGGITVTLADFESAGLSAVIERYREVLLGGKDASLLRLQPPVHLNDAEATDEFWKMVGDPLLRHRLEAIDTVEAGLDGTTLDDDATAAWMQTLNGVRLYLRNAPESRADALPAPARAAEPAAGARDMLYEWLTEMLGQLVGVAAEGLPPGAGD